MSFLLLPSPLIEFKLIEGLYGCRQAAHETFLMDLDVLSIQLSKMSRLKYITELEINGYESDTASIGNYPSPPSRLPPSPLSSRVSTDVVDDMMKIEQTHLETQEKLINLKEELKSAQRDRACRIEYDSIAKLIKVLPDRKAGEECVSFPFSPFPPPVSPCCCCF